MTENAPRLPIAPRFEDILSSDVRSVLLRVEDAPLLYTPSGKSPMVPTSVELEFDISTRRVRYLSVRGRRCDDGRWHRSDRMTRRVAEPDAPEWLAAVVEEHRP